jgi:HK97 family phage prohead protease
VESPAVSDAETKHYAEIGLTEEGVCRKSFVPYEVKTDDEKRSVTFTITTGAVDRDNDTINVDGWDLKSYLKNPVVLFAHRSDLPPVAKATSVVKTAGALRATTEFLPAGIYPLADQVYEMVKRGFLRATSVGFRPKRDKYSWNEERGGIDFEEQELLEFSVVPVPSNPEALLSASKDFAAAGPESLAAFRKAFDLAEQALRKEPPDETVLITGTAALPHFKRERDGAEWKDGEWVKAGRRLSAKTEASIKSARNSVDEAAKHLKDVLAEAEEEIEDMPKSAPVLMVVPNPAPPMFLVNPKDVQAAVAAVVSEQVKSAVNRARGRLD